jgi:hypothetical protein
MAPPDEDGNAEYGGSLPLHPLICGLAVGAPGGKIKEANEAAAYWLSPERAPDAYQPTTWSTEWSAALTKFASAERQQVVVFAGYLGPELSGPYPDHETNGDWQLLYQDSKAISWLIVPQSAIVLHNRCEDRKAAFRLRDYIWVRADAPVRQGTQEESEQARFLVGTFTSAGDLHGALSDASTASAGSGILCAPTPECCHRGTN